MKIMTSLGFAITLSMFGGTIASAHTVPAPQTTVTSQMSASDTAAATIADMPQKATSKAQPQTKTLALANFGQWDEAGSEN